MPQSYVPRDVFEQLYQRVRALEAEVKRLREKPYITIPIYDWNNQPQDNLEGQVALFINTPGSTAPAQPTTTTQTLGTNTFTAPALNTATARRYFSRPRNRRARLR